MRPRGKLNFPTIGIILKRAKACEMYFSITYLFLQRIRPTQNIHNGKSITISSFCAACSIRTSLRINIQLQKCQTSRRRGKGRQRYFSLPWYPMKSCLMEKRSLLYQPYILIKTKICGEVVPAENILNICSEYTCNTSQQVTNKYDLSHNFVFENCDGVHFIVYRSRNTRHQRLHAK